MSATTAPLTRAGLIAALDARIGERVTALAIADNPRASGSPAMLLTGQLEPASTGAATMRARGATAGDTGRGGAMPGLPALTAPLTAYVIDTGDPQAWIARVIVPAELAECVSFTGAAGTPPGVRWTFGPAGTARVDVFFEEAA